MLFHDADPLPGLPNSASVPSTTHSPYNKGRFLRPKSCYVISSGFSLHLGEIQFPYQNREPSWSGPTRLPHLYLPASSPLYAGCPLSFLRSLTSSFFSDWNLVPFLFIPYRYLKLTNGLVDWSWRWSRNPFLLCLIVNIYEVPGSEVQTLYTCWSMEFYDQEPRTMPDVASDKWQQNFTQSVCFSSLTWTIAWKEYVIPPLPSFEISSLLLLSSMPYLHCSWQVDQATWCPWLSYDEMRHRWWGHTHDPFSSPISKEIQF